MNTVVVPARYIPEHVIDRCLDCKYHSYEYEVSAICTHPESDHGCFNYIEDESEIPDWCPLLKDQINGT